MFSGIVECTSPTISLLREQNEGTLVRFKVQRPPSFTDIRIGDSIAMDGICLTVEAFDTDSIQFALGAETMKVTGWSIKDIETRKWNMERSLKFGDRIHGHLVTGHVDFQGKVVQEDRAPEALTLTVEFPKSASAYFWRKGSVCLNGVSLTINEADQNTLQVHLIPETLRATNLGSLTKGSPVNIEVDTFARGLVHYFKEREPQGGTPLR